jgi:thiamine biosynthesis lipoprotein
MHSGEYRFNSFAAMGTRVRFWIDRSAGHRAAAALRSGETFIHDFDRRLSRFRPDSELSRLNADPAEEVVVSTLMLRFIEAALAAAEASGGLVDPTLVDEIERSGYRESRSGVAAEPIAAGLAKAPPPSPAGPAGEARWREITVDHAARTITRPPGLRLDSGGSGKGLAADLLAGIWKRLLPEGTAFIIDCGGDMRLGDLAQGDAPYVIRVETVPEQPEPVELQLYGGGVATSGIGKRLWRHDGGYAHHLIDPSTGRPAWTGVLSATAIGPTALLAETTAKRALLGGPQAAAGILAESGGLIVRQDGRTQLFEIPDMEPVA